MSISDFDSSEGFGNSGSEGGSNGSGSNGNEFLGSAIDTTPIDIVYGDSGIWAQGTKGGPGDANPATPIGEVLPIYTNPDGSRSITGDRNVDATLIGSKWGTTNITFSFPTSGSNYNGTGLASCSRRRRVRPSRRSRRQPA